jgi:hypothetical protein
MFFVLPGRFCILLTVQKYVVADPEGLTGKELGSYKKEKE